LEGPFFFFLDEEDEAVTDLSFGTLSTATFFSSRGGRKCDGVIGPVVVINGTVVGTVGEVLFSDGDFLAKSL
jgi:hypothetical protein